jgi:hypothetical protein
MPRLDFAGTLLLRRRGNVRLLHPQGLLQGSRRDDERDEVAALIGMQHEQLASRTARNELWCVMSVIRIGCMLTIGAMLLAIACSGGHSCTDDRARDAASLAQGWPADADDTDRCIGEALVKEMPMTDVKYLGTIRIAAYTPEQLMADPAFQHAAILAFSMRTQASMTIRTQTSHTPDPAMLGYTPMELELALEVLRRRNEPACFGATPDAKQCLARIVAIAARVIKRMPNANAVPLPMPSAPVNPAAKNCAVSLLDSDLQKERCLDPACDPTDVSEIDFNTRMYRCRGNPDPLPTDCNRACPTFNPCENAPYKNVAACWPKKVPADCVAGIGYDGAQGFICCSKPYPVDKLNPCEKDSG